MSFLFNTQCYVRFSEFLKILFFTVFDWHESHVHSFSLFLMLLLCSLFWLKRFSFWPMIFYEKIITKIVAYKSPMRNIYFFNIKYIILHKKKPKENRCSLIVIDRGFDPVKKKTKNGLQKQKSKKQLKNYNWKNMRCGSK